MEIILDYRTCEDVERAQQTRDRLLKRYKNVRIVPDALFKIKIVYDNSI